jgi:hypothetical protein
MIIRAVRGIDAITDIIMLESQHTFSDIMIPLIITIIGHIIPANTLMLSNHIGYILKPPNGVNL